MSYTRARSQGWLTFAARRGAGVALVLLLAAGALVEARGDDNAASSITFILDCSSGMSDPVRQEGPVREVGIGPATSRLDAAREALLAMLTRLAEEENHEASVILYGHRLAWDGSEEPQLIEQVDYLEQTLGFGALDGLMPGDDVEVIRPLGSFGPAELAVVGERLNHVQAWGESPLYYALVKALDGFSGRRNSARCGIVVLTAGENRQWLARNRWNRDNLGKQLESSHVPIHIVSYGGSPDGEQLAELRELVGISGGSIKPAAANEALVAQLATTFVTSTRLQAAIAATSEEPDASGPALEGARPAATVNTVAAVTPRSAAAERNTVQGRVAVYSDPVRRALVTVVGADVPPVRTDREGRFTIRGVAPGKYRLEVEATHKNVLYRGAQEFTVQAAPNHGPVLEVHLENRR